MSSRLVRKPDLQHDDDQGPRRSHRTGVGSTLATGWSDPERAAFAPDGRQLVLASSQRTVKSLSPIRWARGGLRAGTGRVVA